MRIHRRRVWAIGVSVEPVGIVEDDFSSQWTQWTWRVYFGPWFIFFNHRASPKRAYDL